MKRALADEEVRRKNERYAILFAAESSQRYHRARATWLSRVDTAINVTALFAGTAAFIDVVGGEGEIVAQYTTALITGLAIVQVVFRLGDNAAKHGRWLERWLALRADIVVNPIAMDAKLSEWVNERTAIEQECIAELTALCVHSENRASFAMGHPERVRRIGRLQRALKQFGTFQSDFPLEVTSTTSTEQSLRS